MLQEVEFLFDNKLIEAVESLIRQSKRSLLLISPFIDLDPRISAALQEKKELADFKLYVLFGKNENDYLRSIKSKSLTFLKDFPNVEIRYNSRLHAKYYQSESEYIMTSMNLYNFSLSHNIEVGVRSQYKGRGLLSKMMESAAELVAEGVGKIKQDLLGQEADMDPVEKFSRVFQTSDRMYETAPKFKEVSGLLNIISSKTIQSYTVVLDNFKQVANGIASQETNYNLKTIPRVVQQTSSSEVKYYSASQLAKSIGCQVKDLINLMETKGLVNNSGITDLGTIKGLKEKRYMGNKYIAYPESLEELKQLTITT